MKRPNLAILSFLAITALAPAAALAVEGSMFHTGWGSTLNIYSTPDGIGQTFPAQVGVQLYWNGHPAVGVPAADIVLKVGLHGGGQPHVSYLCSDQVTITATGPTNSQGIAYFPTDPIRAFGPASSQYNCHVEVIYNGVRYYVFPESPMSGNPTCKIYWKTADLSADGSVNLTDSALLSTYFQNGVYDVRTDFNSDGVENLSDIAIYSGAVGQSCP